MNGILLIDKDAGWTSMDVCAKLRGLCGERRIGHGGTLDPMATGLLVVFLGRATRAVEFAEAHGKTYEAKLRLGLVTDTQDVTGTVLETRPAAVTDEELEAVLARFRGDILQIPPMYSAVKVNGQRLYRLARKGREVERAPRPVTISELAYLGRADDGDMLLRVQCSKGTYIRTLCHDIGEALGCGGAMSALRRTRCGAFKVEDAHTVADLQAAAEAGTVSDLLLPVETLCAGTLRLELTAGQARAVRNGGRFTCPADPGRYLLYAPDGAFLALGEVSPESGEMRVVKRFFEV